MKFEVSTPVKI